MIELDLPSRKDNNEMFKTLNVDAITPMNMSQLSHFRRPMKKEREPIDIIKLGFTKFIERRRTIANSPSPSHRDNIKYTSMIFPIEPNLMF